MSKKLAHLKNVEIKKYLARRGAFTQKPISSKLKFLEPEISLGRAILDRALLDATEDPEAKEWFDEENEDFILICFIAYLEPEEAIRIAHTIIEQMESDAHIGDILEKLSLAEEQQV